MVITTMEILFIRHTQVGVTPGLCYGHTDVPLASEAKQHIQAVLDKLPWVPGASDCVLTSPALRCETMARTLTSNYTVEPRLREFHFGRWEGKPWAKIPRHEIDAWNADLKDARPPGGESFSEVQGRAVAALNEAIAQVPQRLLVITHGGVIRASMAWFLGLALPDAVRLQIDYGGLCAVRTDSTQTIVDYINR